MFSWHSVCNHALDPNNLQKLSTLKSCPIRFVATRKDLSEAFPVQFFVVKFLGQGS